MRLEKFLHRMLACAVVGMTTLGLAVSAHAYDVYHGVQAALNGHVLWTNNSFIVSGIGGPTLSFFYFPNDNAAQNDQQLGAYACIVKVAIPGAPMPGHQTALGVAGNTPANANFQARYPWTITFDNNPPGHWSIAKADIMTVTNPTASTVAALGFQGLVAAHGAGVTVINGAQHNCMP